MTALGDWQRPPAQRSRLQVRVLRWAIAGVAAVLLFGLGVALGDALDDDADPEHSPTQTLVRTLRPLPLSGPRTVTVTVTAHAE